MKKFKIENLSKQQLRLIAVALEQYSRFICGQLGECYLPSLEHGMMKEQYYKYKEENPDDTDNAMTNYCKIRDEVQQHLDLIKMKVWKMPPNGHHGIKYDKKADLGYEMYKQILSLFEEIRETECEKKGEKYTSNVHSGQPLKLTDEDKIIVKEYKNTKENIENKEENDI